MEKLFRIAGFMSNVCSRVFEEENRQGYLAKDKNKEITTKLATL